MCMRRKTLCGPLKDASLSQRAMSPKVLKWVRHGQTGSSHSGCRSKSCLQNRHHFKSSVPAIYLHFLVSIYIYLNFFRSCVLHFCLRDLLTVKMLGSLKSKLEFVCNLGIQGPLYADHLVLDFIFSQHKNPDVATYFSLFFNFLSSFLPSFLSSFFSFCYTSIYHLSFFSYFFSPFYLSIHPFIHPYIQPSFLPLFFPLFLLPFLISIH